MYIWSSIRNVTNLPAFGSESWYICTSHDTGASILEIMCCCRSDLNECNTKYDTLLQLNLAKKPEHLICRPNALKRPLMNHLPYSLEQLKTYYSLFLTKHVSSSKEMTEIHVVWQARLMLRVLLCIVQECLGRLLVLYPQPSPSFDHVSVWE